MSGLENNIPQDTGENFTPDISLKYQPFILAERGAIINNTKENLGELKKVLPTRSRITSSDINEIFMKSKNVTGISSFSLSTTNDLPNNPDLGNDFSTLLDDKGVIDDGLTAGFGFKIEMKNGVHYYGGLDIFTRKIYGFIPTEEESSSIGITKESNTLNNEEVWEKIADSTIQKSEAEKEDIEGEYDVIGGSRIDKWTFGTEKLVINEQLDLGEAGVLSITGTIHGEISGFGTVGGKQIQQEFHRIVEKPRYHELTTAKGLNLIGIGGGYHIHIRYLPKGIFEIYTDTKLSLDTHGSQAGSASTGIVAKPGNFVLDLGMSAEYKKWPNNSVFDAVSTPGSTVGPTAGIGYKFGNGIVLDYRYTGKCMGIEERSCSSLSLTIPTK